ncbi:MAG: glycine--tRNA ligase subunit beta [Pseudomonadota bacterium]
MPDLLIELFSEEIPARMQPKAAEDLKRLVTDGMVEAGLTYASAGTFATPRRLTLAVEGVLAETPDVREERKGPRVDAPEKALEGFLRSTGLTKDQLEARADKKGDVWFAVIERKGRPAEDVIAEVLEATVRSFPWPKSMRWGSGALRWVRPLHSILCLLSDESGARVVPLSVDETSSGDTTEGHRFMAPGRFSVTGFDDYRARLAKAHVILDPAERGERIWVEATNMAFAQGLEAVEDPGLLREVAGLVEWPVVLMGDIAEEFLDLPPEVLQTSMKEHQKFFSVRNPRTGRIEKYVTVANRETVDGGATILAGNGKVLAARLADAKFFWENDLRTVDRIGLEGMAKPLENVTFHSKLGTVADRIARVAALAREIAPMVGADADLAEQAARVAKADLASEMVYEFPELQGLMGRYYAEKAGLAPALAAACEAHYQPLGPSDDVPTEPVSIAVALADKIDTLTGFWAIDEKPTGSKDPFALRRAALGVVRLVLGNGLRMNLNAQQGPFPSAATLVGARDRRDGPALADTDDLLSFIADRLKVHLRGEGIRHDVIDACFQLGGQDDLVLLVNRVRSLQAFLTTEDGENLVQGWKRANNILAAEEKKDGVEYSGTPDVKFAEEDAERALFAALDGAEPAIAAALKAEDFEGAMTALAALRAPIDAFFTDVQVNTDNAVVRRNRLCLLNRIRAAMAPVARFEALEG